MLASVILIRERQLYKHEEGATTEDIGLDRWTTPVARYALHSFGLPPQARKNMITTLNY